MCTSSSKVQSMVSTYLLCMTLYLRHGRERQETRLVPYLAGTAAVEDWVVFAAALLGCI